MTREELSVTLQAHYAVHCQLELQDIYKLLYQAVFGPEHSITQWRVAAGNLYLEMLHLPESLPGVPLLEPLSPVLCRVNLQPYQAQGMSVQVLWKLFRQTVETYEPGTLEDLQRCWAFFLATPWGGSYPVELCEQFWQRMATVGFPPVHHSCAYAQANQPHYRVVLRALAEQKFLSQEKS